MSDPLDLYSQIGEIRDSLETLLHRGKPVSVSDLEALLAKVEAKSRPTVELSAEKVAQHLAPALVAQLPTPAGLAAAGQQVSAQLQVSLQAATAASVQQAVAGIGQSVQQLNQAAATLTQAANGVPRSVEVDYIRGWRYVAALALGPLGSVLLLLWGLGAFSGVSQAKYDQLLGAAQAVSQERDTYEREIQVFKKDMSKGNKELRRMTEQYFPPHKPTP